MKRCLQGTGLVATAGESRTANIKNDRQSMYARKTVPDRTSIKPCGSLRLRTQAVFAGLLLILGSPEISQGGVVNDDCINASSITAGTTLFDTTNATTDGPPDCPGL